MDALDCIAFRRFGTKEKAEFRKIKAEEELSATLEDPKKFKPLASKFEETIRRQRIAAGLKG